MVRAGHGPERDVCLADPARDPAYSHELGACALRYALYALRLNLARDLSFRSFSHDSPLRATPEKTPGGPWSVWVSPIRLGP